jgi:parvulin-like peptidyl-prolyl isomerase
MRWRTFVACVAASWLMAGCQSGPFPVASVGESQAQDAARTVGSEAAVTRSQKPEIETPKPAAPKPTAEAISVHRGEVRACIRAIVNGVPILQEEVAEACHHLLLALRGKGLSADEFKKQEANLEQTVLDQLIERELLRQEAMSRLSAGGKKQVDKIKEEAGKEFDKHMRKVRRELAGSMNIKTEEDFRRFLESQQVSLEGMRRQYERQYFADQYLFFLISTRLDQAVGHAQIMEYYQTHPEEFVATEGVEWQDIFFDPSNPRYGSRPGARQAAEQVVARLRAGEDIAKFLPLDDGDSKTRDGQGMGHRRGEIQPAEAEAMLFRLNDGEVGDVVEVPGGFHVVRVITRTHAGPMPFNEKVQTQIRNKLRTEIGMRERDAIMKELKRNAIVEIMDKP